MQPLAVVPARRAVVLVLKEKADLVASNGIVFRSARLQVPAPAVVKLRYVVHVPFRAGTALTRRAVFARDDWTCQYCGSPAENVDHVVPRSRGGGHTWDNVVGGVPPVQRPQGEPARPGGRDAPAEAPFVPRDGFRLSLGRLEPEWEPYLL